MNYSYQQESIWNQSGSKYSLYEDNKKLSFARVIHLWANDAPFRAFYNDLLSKSEFDSYFWEHPPNKSTTLERDYEFVLIESQALSRIQANPKPFRNYINTNDLIVDFGNLRGDAYLIAPSNQGKSVDYSSIAKFVRSATTDQIDQFWQRIGVVYAKELGQEWKWLSTSGLGVYWLHIRIDTRPKYYTYRAYRNVN